MNKQPIIETSVTKSKGWIIEQLGGACFLCGFDTKLHLHYKVPKSQGESNKLENLALLCPNHHEMLHMGLVSAKSLEI